MTVMPEEPKKVLVVDDEPLIRQTLSLLLRNDYEVTAVASGEEAIEASRREQFPVVILDLCMEGLSGIETLKRLKQIREQQNVIILTAYESTETAIAALNLGAFNYLTKPFERAHLREVVSRGFDDYRNRRARKEDFRQRLMSVHDDFFALLCHEFNTPLNIILGFADLLSQTVEDPEQLEWSQHIKRAGDQLHEVLMEIVDYVAASHLAAAGIDTEFSPASLFHPLTQGFRDREAHVEISNLVPIDRKFRGPAKSLLTLARKLAKMASRRSSRIRVTISSDFIEPEGSTILRLEVSGTGIRAVSREEVDKLFEPYQTVDHSESSSALGLELATSRKIAEYAGGTVRCDFGNDGELVFIAELPVT